LKQTKTTADKDSDLYFSHKLNQRSRYTSTTKLPLT